MWLLRELGYEVAWMIVAGGFMVVLALVVPREYFEYSVYGIAGMIVIVLAIVRWRRRRRST